LVVSIFRQSQAPGLRFSTPTCRYCSEPVVPGTDRCAYHGSEAFRLVLQPQRAGYVSKEYRIARRAAIRRAKGKCEACGAKLKRRPNGRVICQTHHKDLDPTNNPPDGSNLDVCCLDCHNGSRRPADPPALPDP
jgi:hypothetical protein